jgi:GNAT superfamily N-acetyltransferase
MALRLVEKRRGGQDKYVWQPFQPNAGNFNPDWWERRQPTLDDPRYVQVIDDEGDEVARIELDDEGFETTNFAGAPELGEERLEIQFFEVSSHRRGRGIGTSVVSLLTKMYPGRRLCGLSVGADCFWASLGWNRYEHVDQTARGPQYSPLFVQPLP